MATNVRERETKYTVDGRFRMPRLHGPAGADPAAHSRQVTLLSAYYDTDDLALLRAGVVLRRRTGDEDLGWQLKIPRGAGDRTEVRRDESTDAVPEELADLLFGIRRGQPLHEVAMVRTERCIYPIHDERGTVLAEVAHDRVQSSATRDGVLVAQQWTEVEAELKQGNEKLLARIDKVLRRAGARPADMPKLAHAIGLPTGPAESSAPLLRYLHAQRNALLDGDLALRQGRGAVHDTRVATRRLRSTLRTFARWLPADSVGVASELAWYAEVLGAARDPEVMTKALTAALEDVPDELVLGPVAARISQEMAPRQQSARAAVRDAIDSDRYTRLLARLDRLLADAGRTKQPSSKKLRRAAEKRSRKADHRLADALGGNADAPLHRARRAAKRARYSWDVLAADSHDAAKQSARYKRLQTILGEHHDSVVLRQEVRALGAAASGRPEENGFTYGLLHARQEQVADRARERAHRWMRPVQRSAHSAGR